MKVILGNDRNSYEMKQELKKHLSQSGIEVIDKTPEETDLFSAASIVSKSLLNEEADRGIVLDEYGVGSSIVANKHKGIICANVFDEHSARMTVEHNNTSVITIGTGIVGNILARKICESFLTAEYDGGRHQVRVDMLNKMC